MLWYCLQPKYSTCYWPDGLDNDSRREFGDYIVTLKKRDIQHDYIDCTLEVMDIEVGNRKHLLMDLYELNIFVLT